MLRAQAPETPVSVDAVASVPVDLANIPEQVYAEAADILNVGAIESAADIEKQLQAVDDDSILLTEEEAELYQDFEQQTRAEIGTIKDDFQLEVGYTQEELLGDAAQVAMAALQPLEEGQEAEESLESQLFDISELAALETDDVDLDEEEDEDDLDGELTVEKVLDIVEKVQDKFELDEEIQDAVDQATAESRAAIEVQEVDQSDMFFAEAMPGLEDDIPEYPAPEFKLNFMWMDKNLGLAVDQIYAKGGRAPLTEFFIWPRKDAWEDLRISLDPRPWMNEREKIVLLNRATEVINYWQDEDKKTIEQAREAFPDCDFFSDN